MDETGDYNAHVARSEKQYHKAYSEWLRTLSPEERAKLKAHEVDKAFVPRSVNPTKEEHVELNDNIRDGAITTYSEDLQSRVLQAIKEGSLKQLMEELAKIEAETQAKKYIIDAREALSYVLSEILTSGYPLVTAKLISKVCGFPFAQESLEQLGQSIGRTRQAVHSMEKQLKSKLGLVNKLRSQKSERARLHYILTNKRNYKENEND